MSKAILHLKNVSKVFESEDVITYALNKINLTIDAGEYVSISGPSGSGKSTLMSILGLLDTPTEGQFTFDGENVSKFSADEAAEFRGAKIGFVFQSFHLIDELSVFDNVALPLSYSHRTLSHDEIAEKVGLVLEKVGLTERTSHKPNQLSGGQQQRAAIARALVTNPQLLLMDEPTGNLDSENSEKIMSLVDKLHNDGTTICLVTHEPKYAAMAEREVHLSDGKIQA